MGFPPVSASMAGVANQLQGRPNFVVPSFVSTFSLPAASVASALSKVAAGLLPTALSSAPNVPVLQQSFVVAPGFLPVPPKLVSQIISGKFVELSELLSSNIVQTHSDSDPQLFSDGRLALTSSPKKPKRRIEDIGSWLEAFAVYWCSRLTFPIDGRISSFTSCWFYGPIASSPAGCDWLMIGLSESMQLLLIWQTWSTLDVQLFNLHATGASVRGHDAVTHSNEPHGATSSTIICRLWNRGQCVAPFALCRFGQKCQSCFGHHRVKDCPGDSSSQQHAESKQPPASPPRSHSKSGWLLSCYILVAFEGGGMFCHTFTVLFVCLCFY